jgi:hypothetical protein
MESVPQAEQPRVYFIGEVATHAYVLNDLTRRLYQIEAKVDQLLQLLEPDNSPFGR